MNLKNLSHRFSEGRELVFRRRQQRRAVAGPADQSRLSPECHRSAVPLRRERVLRTGNLSFELWNNWKQREFKFDELDRTINQSNVFSVHHTVASSSSSSSSATASSSPGEWVRLLPIHKWDDGDLNKLPPLHWTCQGAGNAGYFSLSLPMKYFPVSSWTSCKFDDLMMSKCDLNLYLWSSYNWLTLPDLFMSFLLLPLDPIWVGSLSLRWVQTVLHRDPRNQRTANPRSGGSLCHSHLHWGVTVWSSVAKIVLVRFNRGFHHSSRPSRCSCWVCCQFSPRRKFRASL